MRIPPSGQAAADTTAALELTEKFKRLEEQFAQLKARVRQAQQLSTLGVAAAMIVHEFNNLLTPVVGYGKSALETDDLEFLRKALQRAVTSAELAVSLSDRLLKLNAAKKSEPQAVSLRSVVEEAYACLCRDLSRDGITVTFDVDESLKIWADPLQVQQVLYNLFLNASEAMKDGHHGRLTVRVCRSLQATGKSRAASPSDNLQTCNNVPPTQEPLLKSSGTQSRGTHANDRIHRAATVRERSGNTDTSVEARVSLPMVLIEVRNTGKPIPKELLPRIFEAFESTKSPDGDGEVRCSGLGLALCRDLIEENGGGISVTSDEAGGTAFQILLPSADAAIR